MLDENVLDALLNLIFFLIIIDISSFSHLNPTERWPIPTVLYIFIKYIGILEINLLLWLWAFTLPTKEKIVIAKLKAKIGLT